MQDISKSSIANKHDDIPIAIDTEAVMKLWLSEVYMNNLPKTIRFTIYMKILELLASYNSYMGFLIHNKTYAIRWKLYNTLPKEIKEQVVCANMRKYTMRDGLDNIRAMVAS